MGVSHNTVKAVRDELEEGCQIDSHDMRIGRDGVKQPTRKNHSHDQISANTNVALLNS